MPSRQYEDIKLSTDLQTLQLVDKYQKDLVSIIHGAFVSYHNVDYFQVNYTNSRFKKRGYPGKSLLTIKNSLPIFVIQSSS